MRVPLVFFFALGMFAFNILGLTAQDASQVDKNKSTTTTVNPFHQSSSSTENSNDKTSTTVAPIPVPTTPAPEKKSDLLHFNLTTSDNKTLCALFSFVARIDITRKENSTQPDEFIYFHESTKLDPTSTCGANQTTLVLLINNDNDKLTLRLNHTSPSYSLDYVQLDSQLAGGQFTNSTAQFTVDDNKSYLCLAYRSISLTKENKPTEENKLPKIVLTLKDLKVDAFRTEKDGNDYRQAIQCEPDFPTNDFVPLAVGCALISLVVIVLIAYIVGRKRSKRLTYQSV